MEGESALVQVELCMAGDVGVYRCTCRFRGVPLSPYALTFVGVTGIVVIDMAVGGGCIGSVSVLGLIHNYADGSARVTGSTRRRLSVGQWGRLHAGAGDNLKRIGDMCPQYGGRRWLHRAFKCGWVDN